ncbi:ankyrin repeat-containing protein [Apiospora arundinis]
MAQPTRYAPELQDLELWHQYEAQLREFYIEKNQTLKQVKASMEEQHGWPVFKRLVTYEVVLRDELKLVKNLTKDDWHAIQHHIVKRSRGDKQSDVYLNGQLVNKKRVTKAMSRYSRHVDISREPSGSDTNAAAPISPNGTQSMVQSSQCIAMRTQAILNIRADSPFNQFALKIEAISGSFTAHEFQQIASGPTQHQMASALHGTPQNTLGQATSLHGTDNYFGELLRGCYVFSNNIFDIEVRRRFLDWVGLVAEKKLLAEFFRLELPTVLAVWEKAFDASFRQRHGKAFNVFIEVGLTVDNGRLVRPHLAKCFAMAIDLGYDMAVGSVARLLKAGVSPNARFDQSSLPSFSFSSTEHENDHYWRCCALKQAAKNRDAEMLGLLLTAGNCRCAKFDHMYGNILLKMVTLRDPFTKRAPSIRCVELLINSGIRVDFLPGAVESLGFIPGWSRSGRAELLVDRMILTDGGVNRDVYEFVARKSQWAQKFVTVSGIFVAADDGAMRLQQYLQTTTASDQAMKVTLLEIALVEAVCHEAITVLECLLKFGVDPNVKKLVSRLPERDDRETWTPVVQAAFRWNTGALCRLLEYGAEFMDFPLIEYAMFHQTVRRGSDYCELERRRGLTIQLLLDKGVLVTIPPSSIISAALVPFRPHYLTTMERDSWIEHIANFKPDYAFCDKLQQHGIGFDSGLCGCNTLHAVLRSGYCNFETVSYMIRCGVRVHSIPCPSGSKLGDTTMLHDFLHNAYVDRWKIFEILLENGADIYATTSTGESTLEASLRSPYDQNPFWKDRNKEGFRESMDIFWKIFQLMGSIYVSSLEFTSGSLLSSLISAGESDENICAGLDAIIDINNYNVSSKGSLLMQAILYRRYPLAMQLVERGADVNLQMNSFPSLPHTLSPTYNTALHVVCDSQLSESSGTNLVRFLLEKGADVNAPPTKRGMTALQYASSAGNMDIATMLLGHGADVNAKLGTHCGQHLRKDGTLTHRNKDQAVDFAASSGHLDLVDLLVKAGGLSGIPGKTGLDGAMVAAKANGHIAIVEYLQRHTGHQLSDEIYEAHRVPSSSGSVKTSSSFDAASILSVTSSGGEYTDGESSCHSSNLFQWQHEIWTCPCAPPTPTADPPGPSCPVSLQPSIESPSAGLMATSGAETLDPASGGADQIFGITTETASDDTRPRSWMNRVATESDGAFEDIHPQMFTSQFPKAGDLEHENQKEESVMEAMDHMSPITRGVLGWIEDTDFGYPPS